MELISDNELLKETLKGAGSVRKAHLKEEIERLWGEDDVKEFSTKLKDRFHDFGLDLQHQLNTDITDYPESEGKNFSDKELTGLYVMFDREHANLKTYRAALTKTLEDFRTYIRVIENDAASGRGEICCRLPCWSVNSEVSDWPASEAYLDLLVADAAHQATVSGP